MFADSPTCGLKLSGLFWKKLQVIFRLIQLSWLLFVSSVLASQSCQSCFSACGCLSALRFGSGEQPLPQPLWRCVKEYYALIVMISYRCQVIHMTMHFSGAIRWFPLSGSHSSVQTSLRDLLGWERLCEILLLTLDKVSSAWEVKHRICQSWNVQTKKAIIEAPQQFSIASYSQGTCKSQILKRRLKIVTTDEKWLCFWSTK